MLKYLIFFLIISFKIYADFPVYSNISGIMKYIDYNGGRDDNLDYPEEFKNAACMGDGVDTICVFNNTISISDKENCITYFYDNLIEPLDYYWDEKSKKWRYYYGYPITKNTLIGYSKTKEGTNPKKLKIC